MSIITTITAREILDSRGNPTIEATCVLSDGSTGVAAVPSGASTGVHEALELRDGDASYHNGKGVNKAIANVNGEIAETIARRELDQRELDTALIKLDGTVSKSRLGANATLSVSLAFARACAVEQGVELFEYLGSLVGNTSFTLPLPALNIINGGKHANNGLDIQEFMIVPVGFGSFAERIAASKNIIDSLRTILTERSLSTELGDEGGFAPHLVNDAAALDLLVEATSAAGYSADDVKLAIDTAASSFYADGIYKLETTHEQLTTDDLIEWYEMVSAHYPIISIEDGLAEDDWAGFTKLTERIGNRMQIVGDDLTVTNISRIQKTIDEKAINAVLIKPNQIGTLSETLDAIMLTKKAGWKPFISHRSGETMDTFIADLAVGTASPFIKAGSLTKPERVCKYDRLIEIETKLNG